MTGIDIAIVVALVVSGVVSFLRGFFREALSLATWVISVLITLTYTSRFATLFPSHHVQSPEARATISAITLFLICMCIGWVARWLCRRILADMRLGLVDRMIGVFFGLGRGVVLVTLLVLAAHLAPTLQQEAWWSESKLLSRFDILARAVHTRLPGDVSQHFAFSPASI